MSVALPYFWPNYAKIMLVFPNYATFLNCALQKPRQIGPKIKFLQSESCTFPLWTVGNGLWQLWLVLARLVRLWVNSRLSFESAGIADAILACLREGTTIRHGLLWDFRLAHTLIPVPHFRALKHQTVSAFNWDWETTYLSKPKNVPMIIKICELCQPCYVFFSTQPLRKLCIANRNIGQFVANNLVHYSVLFNFGHIRRWDQCAVFILRLTSYAEQEFSILTTKNLGIWRET